ncbi:MAG TPA: hypothetical protein VHY84_26500 [Bryobacteraceae bacterium]|jgi:hypothetical protein|nr:hypothetical protein [Bryobacteraceae bacterium]
MKKNAAAVILGRKGGLKGGIVRAARLTPEQRSASARKAVRARRAKAGKAVAADRIASTPDTSDHALARLLIRLRMATDPAEIRGLSEQIERTIFHNQFDNG